MNGFFIIISFLFFFFLTPLPFCVKQKAACSISLTFLAHAEEMDLWYFFALTDLSVSLQSQTTRGTMS